MTGSHGGYVHPIPDVDLNRIDQGVLEVGQTVRCPLCGREVYHSIGPVMCLGENGWHLDRPRRMERVL